MQPKFFSPTYPVVDFSDDSGLIHQSHCLLVLQAPFLKLDKIK